MKNGVPTVWVPSAKGALLRAPITTPLTSTAADPHGLKNANGRHTTQENGFALPARRGPPGVPFTNGPQCKTWPRFRSMGYHTARRSPYCATPRTYVLADNMSSRS